jgi:hypothetical protein
MDFAELQCDYSAAAAAAALTHRRRFHHAAAAAAHIAGSTNVLTTPWTALSRGNSIMAMSAHGHKGKEPESPLVRAARCACGGTIVGLCARWCAAAANVALQRVAFDDARRRRAAALCLQLEA